jgi:hemerythrin superfamily protein
MNAIDLLESQHREVEDLFSKIEKTKNASKKEQAFLKLADALAIHAAIEEHHFYPAVREKRTEDIVIESLQEHLGIKRALSELLDMDVADKAFDAKLAALETEVSRHVEEEESELFPRVLELFDDAELEVIGQEMSAEQADLEEQGSPRDAVPSETQKPASI